MNLQAGPLAVLAGGAAILSALTWVLWLLSGGTAGPWPVVLWNLLLAPIALVWMFRLEVEAGTLIAMATGAGILSQIVWAGATLAAVFVPRVETVCLLLAGLWWLGLGASLLGSRRSLALLTLALAITALLDGILVAVETRTSAVPWWLAPAGSVRPLLVPAWSVVAGVDLIRTRWLAPPPDATSARVAARWERFGGRKR